jgi:digeranylgeranylglycerophospholipid reductase
LIVYHLFNSFQQESFNVYDVVIIGAGPGGALAAKVLAEKGLKVVILDKKSKVGIPAHCGEGLSRYAVESNGLPVEEEWIRLRVKGARIFVPNGKSVLTPGEGYAVDRPTFDQSVARKAVAAGAELHMETAARGMEHKDGIWTVTTNKGEFQAPFVIGADGVGSAVAGWAGLQGNTDAIGGYQYKFDSDYVHANMPYTFNGKNCLTDEWLDFHFTPSAYPQGYVWVFPRGDLYNIGICGNKGYKKALEGFLKEHNLDPKKAVGKNMGRIPRSGILPKYVKDQVLIIGDAGGLTNPVTKGGVHAALYSGRLAAEAILKAREANEMVLLEQYDQQIKKSGFALDELMKNGKLLYTINDEEANAVGDIVDGGSIMDFSYFKAMMVGMRNPKILPKVPIFLKIKRAIELSMKYGW